MLGQLSCVEIEASAAGRKQGTDHGFHATYPLSLALSRPSRLASACPPAKCRGNLLLKSRATQRIVPIGCATDLVDQPRIEMGPEQLSIDGLALAVVRAQRGVERMRREQA